LRDLVRRHAKSMFARLTRETTPEPINRRCRRGSTQSSPDCVLICRKRCANRRKHTAAVAEVSHQLETSGDSIGLKSAANLSSASRATDTTAGMSWI